MKIETGIIIYLFTLIILPTYYMYKTLMKSGIVPKSPPIEKDKHMMTNC